MADTPDCSSAPADSLDRKIRSSGTLRLLSYQLELVGHSTELGK
jgi:hypothetical protein